MSIVLVTGGAGFIGSHLVDRILDQGLGVRVLDNLSTGSLRNLQKAADRQATPGAAGRHARLELMIGDIRDERLVRRAMQHVDQVFHLAALSAGVTAGTWPAEMHTVNVLGTLNVLQAATTEGVRRVVFASCASVYGAADGSPLGEDRPPRPDSPFAASKLAAEVYCTAYHTAHHLETVILRYFSVYGPRQTSFAEGSVVPALIDTLRRGQRPTIAGDGRAMRDYLFVEDAVEATLGAGAAPDAGGRVVNVASGQTASVMELLDILKRLLQTDAVPRLGRTRPASTLPVRAQTALARQLLSCVPRTSLVAGLARAVQHVADPLDEGLLAEAGHREERSDV
jgi:nucleoside-diphosphate-sugar epimerase